MHECFQSVFFLSQVPVGLYAIEWSTGRRPWIGFELLNEKALKSFEYFRFSGAGTLRTVMRVVVGSWLVGTRITQASECFVHWKDCKCDHEWGLNFTTPADARCFRECCLVSSALCFAYRTKQNIRFVCVSVFIHCVCPAYPHRLTELPNLRKENLLRGGSCISCRCLTSALRNPLRQINLSTAVDSVLNWTIGCQEITSNFSFAL